MKLKVTQTYFDRKEDKYVEKSKDGQYIEREEKRAKELIAAGVAVEYVPEEKEPEADATPQPKKETTAKPKKTK